MTDAPICYDPSSSDLSTPPLPSCDQQLDQLYQDYLVAAEQYDHELSANPEDETKDFWVNIVFIGAFTLICIYIGISTLRQPDQEINAMLSWFLFMLGLFLIPTLAYIAFMHYTMLRQKVSLHRARIATIVQDRPHFEEFYQAWKQQPHDRLFGVLATALASQKNSSASDTDQIR